MAYEQPTVLQHQAVSSVLMSGDDKENEVAPPAIVPTSKAPSKSCKAIWHEGTWSKSGGIQNSSVFGAMFQDWNSASLIVIHRTWFQTLILNHNLKSIHLLFTYMTPEAVIYMDIYETNMIRMWYIYIYIWNPLLEQRKQDYTGLLRSN